MDIYLYVSYRIQKEIDDAEKEYYVKQREVMHIHVHVNTSVKQIIQRCRDGSAKKYRNIYATKQGMMACSNNNMLNPIGEKM